MGKKKITGEYNDFVDGEKLRDNAEIRTSLQQSSSTARTISPPAARLEQRGGRSKATSGPKKPLLTHFLCFPLVTHESRPRLQQGLEKLKAELRDVVSTQAVRPIGTLHLTLGVMSLDETRLQEAKQFFQDLDLHKLLRNANTQRDKGNVAEDVTVARNITAAAVPDTDPLTINIESLIPMQTPQRTSTLYAEPLDPSQRLLPFASTLKERFVQEGFMVEDTRPLRLHATIINTIYAKSSRRGEGHGPRSKSLQFDARELIERFEGFIWVECLRLEKLQICKMGAKMIWSSGVEGDGEIVDERYEAVFEKNIFA